MSKTSISASFNKKKDLSKLRSEIEPDSWQNGCIETTDGIVVWMTPEEVNIQKIRKKNAHNRYVRPQNPETKRKRARKKLLQSVPLIVGAIIIGSIVGLLLVRSGG